MAGKTPPEPEQSETAPETPQPDPALMRPQILQQQYQQINGQIMELRQKRQLMDDMITDATIRAAEIRGALNEITPKKG